MKYRKINDFMYNKERFELQWEKYLEQCKIKKILVTKYNTKQALIKALEKLGVPSDFSHNEILLQFFVTEFSNEIEPFEFGFDDLDSLQGSFYMVMKTLQENFTCKVKDYIEIIRNGLLIKKNDNYISVTIVDTSYDEEINCKVEIDLQLKEMVKRNYFQNGYIEKKEVIYDKQNNATIVRVNNTDILSRHNSSIIGVLSSTTENIYDMSYRMLSDTEYTLSISKFNIDNFSLANDKNYNEIKSLTVDKSYAFGRYIEKNQFLDSEDIVELQYQTTGFNFIDFNQEKIPLEKEIDFNYRYNNLYEQQVNYYKEHNIDEEEFIIKWNDNGFYSVVYEFSLEMMAKLNDSLGKKRIRIKKY